MNNKKSLFSLLSVIGLMSANSLWAESITPDEAQRIANQFLTQVKANQQEAPQLRNSQNNTPCELHSVTMPELESDLYLFNVSDRQGFVIVAADDCATEPVLGYSTEGNLRTDSMPDGLRFMLQSYANQMQQARELGLTPAPAQAPKYVSEDIVVEPLVKAQWNQEAPFYDQEPAIGSLTHGLTGCSTTALCQIMNYWQWPKQGRGQHVNRNLPTDSIDYTQSVYDWDNMLDNYELDYTESQGDAVAKLMHDCSVAMNSEYDEKGTSSFTNRAITAMVCYFKYSTDARYLSRDNYEGNWDDMLRTELSAGRPILYGGQGLTSQEGGHSFVCDGYDSEGYFHFNFGWSGYGDCFLKTSAIKVNGNNFSYGQDATIGIHPDYTESEPEGCLMYELTEEGTLRVYNVLDGVADVIVPERAMLDGVEYPVTEIGESAFFYNGDVRTVRLSDNITSCGEYAMAFCMNLEHVELSNGMTEIPAAMFSVSSLKSVVLPASITKIGESAFEKCTQLIDVYNHAALPQKIDRYTFPFNLGKSLTVHVYPECLADFSSSRVNYYWSRFNIVGDLEEISDIQCITAQPKSNRPVEYYDLWGRKVRPENHRGIVIIRK